MSVQATEAAALPPLAESETLPINSVELHQVSCFLWVAQSPHMRSVQCSECRLPFIGASVILNDEHRCKCSGARL